MNDIIKYIKLTYKDSLSKYFKGEYDLSIRRDLQIHMTNDILSLTEGDLPNFLDTNLIRHYIKIDCITEKIKIKLSYTSGKCRLREEKFKQFIEESGVELGEIYSGYSTNNSQEKHIARNLRTIRKLIEEVMEIYLFGSTMFIRAVDAHLETI